MAEHVSSAVVGGVVGGALSALTNKWRELTGVSNKIHRLEWKLLKIRSAIKESNKYDIKNETLRKMLQELMDVELEATQVLQDFENSSAAHLQHQNQVVAVRNPIIAPDTQQLDQAVAMQDPRIDYKLTLLQRIHCLKSFDYLVSIDLMRSSLPQYIAALRSLSSSVLVGPLLLGARLYAENMKGRIRNYGQDLILRMKEIQKLNRILERVEGISGDINDFLEMLRHQKRKKERRRRYRPYKGFFKLAYLELARDALGYWWARVSWMRFLVPEIAAFVETKSKAEYGLKASGTMLSGVSKYWLML